MVYNAERMEENAWSSKCRTLKVLSGSFPREKPRKTWDRVIKSNLKGTSTRT